MLPGPEWVEEDNQKLAFRRCRGGQIEKNNLLEQVTALGLSDKTCKGSTLAEDGSRLFCVANSGELIVANLRQHARTIIPLGGLGEGTSTPQLLSSPDGRRLVLHDPLSYALLVSTDEALLGNTQAVMRNADLGSVDDLAFSDDGHWLAVARPIGGISVWDAATMTLLGNVSGEVSTFHYVVLSPTSKLLAVLGPGGAATLWDLDPQSWEAKACEIAGRDLSESERIRYLPDKAYIADIPTCR
jgi:WD40 repeat protein